MLAKISILSVATLLLAGCATQSPVTTSPTPSQSESSSASPSTSPSVSPSATASPSPSASIDAVTAKFINSMETTCLYARGVGVTETISTDGKTDGVLIMLPEKQALYDGYTAGWIPADGGAAEVIFESDVFDSCSIANTVSLLSESGSDINEYLDVTYDPVTDVYTATTSFSEFTRKARYQMGEGGIAYSVIGTDGQGRTIATKMKYGMPKAEHVEALRKAIDALFAD